MNWDYSGTRSYVDVIPPTPIFNPHPAYGRSPFWPTLQAEAGLQPGVLRQPCGSDQGGASLQHTVNPLARRPSGSVETHQRQSLLAPAILPPVEPSKQLASTPELSQGVESPGTSRNTPQTLQTAFTPPVPANQTRPLSGTQPADIEMADPRRQPGQPGQQRPMMPPPETPSRVMQASPGMFPTLQFSPDLLSTQNFGPMSAPIYPQQRLFWDPSHPLSESNPMDQFQTPYQESFDTSFHSSSTVVPNYSPVIPQEPVYELPQQQQPPPPNGPFLDTTAFPMPFQTSPRPPPPAMENPTQFLSSPARRFGGAEPSHNLSSQRPVREVPAYHHQIEESRRERELERRRTKASTKRADADLIMSSVRRALSPSRSLKPSLQRSLTYSGVTAHQPQLRRRPSKVSFNDSASVSSIASAESSRNGRTSPPKSLRSKRSFSGLSKSRSLPRSRTALSLAIDENGVAKTVLAELPESDDDMDMDAESQSVVSSADEDEFNMIHSQSQSFVADEDGSISGFSHISAGSSSKQLDIGRSTAVSRLSQNAQGTVLASSGSGRIRPQRHSQISVDTRNSTIGGKGDAQKALRAIIEDRSRSASTLGEHSSSRQSDSSVQFHSSPPVQQSQYGEFNASPTTITDPDLATPSTDQDSYGSLGTMRCICNSSLPDGSMMIQCDSCSKWLHAKCIGIDRRQLSDSYTCIYCEQTPVRHPTNRGSVRSSVRGAGNSASPLAHKSSRSHRSR